MNESWKTSNEIGRELAREIEGSRNPDAPVRRDCAFCGFERTPKDDNHHDTCPYWVFFG